ncbi:MAG: ABC transporter substrate-binding protein [Sphingomonas sp.]
MAARRPFPAKSWAITVASIGAVVGLMLFQLLGLGREAAAAGGADLPRTLTIASIAYPYKGRQTYNGLNNTVIEQGWLKAELARRGVRLVWFPVPTAIGGPLINEGFAGKRIDFAAYGDFPAIIANAGGVDARLIVPMGRGQNSYLVVRNGLAATSIRDLKGKRIALHRGRPWELPFSKLLDANGLTLGDFQIVNINPNAAHAALASGDIDAVFLLSDGILLQKKGQGRIIWSTKSAPADWKMRAELFGRKDFIDSQPGLTRLVAEAYVRAAHWSSLPGNRTRVIREAARGETPVDVVEEDYDDPRVTWRQRFSPLFDAPVDDHYRSVADYTFANRLVRRKVDAKDLLDRRFVDAAIRDLGLDGYWQAQDRSAALSTPPSLRTQGAP